MSILFIVMTLVLNSASIVILAIVQIKQSKIERRLIEDMAELRRYVCRLVIIDDTDDVEISKAREELSKLWSDGTVTKILETRAEGQRLLTLIKTMHKNKEG